MPGHTLCCSLELSHHQCPWNSGNRWWWWYHHDHLMFYISFHIILSLKTTFLKHLHIGLIVLTFKSSESFFSDIIVIGTHVPPWIKTSNRISRENRCPPPDIFSFSTAVTLKIRSRSPKSNQFFVMPQLYIHNICFFGEIRNISIHSCWKITSFGPLTAAL